LAEDAAERLRERAAALATYEVPADPFARARVQLSVEVVGQVEGRLVAGRDPGAKQDAQHVCLDATRQSFVSAPYDLAVALGEPTDAELVRRAQDGNVDAFAEIVRRYERRLRLVLGRILDDPRDVEEAIQDSFVQAWRNLDRYRGEAALFTWLYRIGVNAALARARRTKHEVLDVDSLETEGAAHVPRDVLPEPAAEARDEGARVLAALAKLPFDYREAVVLRDLAGLSNEDVAAALGITLAAAKSRIHRGRLRVRDLLEPGGD
jgi:RNA polymerase sigma-70 factor, ECF subfamily